MSALTTKIGRRYDRKRRNNRRVGKSKDTSKHMRRWFVEDEKGRQRPALTHVPIIAGKQVEGGKQYPVESRSTARRSWTVRTENRRRNRAARISRKANR